MKNMQMVDLIFPGRQDIFWHEWKLNPHSTANNISLAYEIIGPVDEERLIESLSQLVYIHEIFRIVFTEKNDTVYVRLLDRINSVVDIIDVTVNSDVEHEARLQIARIRQHVFNLEQGPLFKIALIKADKQRYFLALCFHHILVDGASEQYIMDIISAAYNQQVRPYHPLSLEHYLETKNFSASMAKEAGARQFWQNQVQTINPEGNDLSAMKPIRGHHKKIGHYLYFALDVGLFKELEKFIASQQSSWFCLLLSAYFITLYHLSDCDQLTVCYAVNCRSKELSRALGCFINILPFSLSLTNTMTFQDVLKCVTECRAQQKLHQQYPFLEIVKLLRQTQGIDIQSLLNIGLMQTHIKTKGLDLNGLKVASVSELGNESVYDLCLEYEFIHEQLQCRLNYREDCFDENLIKNFSQYFLRTLQNFLSLSTQPVGTFSLLSDDERQRILMDWNNTARDFSFEQSLLSIIASQASKNPQNSALIFENERFSYEDLEQCVDRIASFLCDHGEKEQELIPIILPTGMYRVVAMLSVLKAGCAYVPIDPTHPPHRIAGILKDCQPSQLITSNDLQSMVETALSIAELPNPRLFFIEQWQEQATIKKSLPVIQPDSLAYVLYTSGSTGVPKGVQISHRSLLNFLFAMKELLAADVHGHFVHIAAYTFDISMLEIYLPLLVGACCVIASDRVAKQGRLLSALIDRYAVRFVQTTPTKWQLLLDTGWQAQRKPVLLCGGEALPPTLIEKLLSIGERVWNVYGPTETTIWSTAYLITEKDKQATVMVPIGRPIANTQVYVFNKQGQPVVVGSTGELYIGGEGVALGYLNQPQLTAERFVALSASSTAHYKKNREIIYRTGDLVKWLPDGNLIFLGRSDQQIKHHGHRIESGDIEAVLATHPHVHQAAVVSKKSLTADHYDLVAFYVLNNKDIAVTADDFRHHLVERLPIYCIPNRFHRLDHLPMTISGKVDRQKLIKLDSSIFHDVEAKGFISDTQNQLKGIFEKILHIKIENVQRNLFDLGMNSLLLITAQDEIEQAFQLKREIKLIDFFKYPTIAALSHFLQCARSEILETPSVFPVANNREPKNNSNDIAIIGMTCRFPGASNVEQFWENICQGKESIIHFSDEQLRSAFVPEEMIHHARYVKSRGIVEQAEYFDADFFNFSPNEAMLTDPQQRLFIEHAWILLESAGYSTQKYPGQIGVYAGADDSQYAARIVGRDPTCVGTLDDFQLFITTGNAFLSTKASYKLNLTGPSLNINTACSTSLVAVITACQQLFNKQCDMAIAGAVSIKQPQQAGYLYQPEGIASPDGHCRPFAQDAAGTVPSGGIGLVLLKRLSDAIRDKDQIYAVIKGYHMNNDGADKLGYTAPSVKQQAKCAATALQNAQLSADGLQYVEAHGTGTLLGDPIEIEALNNAFRQTTDKKQFCAIGSVKSNIGHADAAAGMAGLIKVVQALRNKCLPPSLHCANTNSAIDFKNSAFYVSQNNLPWNADDAPRRAGVNCLGLGGTNAFLVVEEPPKMTKNRNNHLVEDDFYILPFSAKTSSALRTMLKNFQHYITALDPSSIDHESDFFADLAYTLQTGRSEFSYRDCLIVQSLSELRAELDNKLIDQTDFVKAGPYELVFFFPGQGCQYPSMGCSLYQREPIFKVAIDQCLQVLQSYFNIDLKTVLFSSELIHQTKYTQPLLFCVEYGLAKLWESWGIQPSILIGHSLGEYVAAHLAGIFTLVDVLKIIVYRAEMINQLETGAMLAVSLGATELEPFLHENLSLASISSPTLCVVSGSEKDVLTLQKDLETQCVVDKPKMRLLNTSHAFHSRMIKKIYPEFIHFMRGIKMYPPSIPIVSNLTGQFSSVTDMTTPEYWADHLVSTVQFSESIQQILKTLKNPLFLTLGPSRELKTLIHAHHSGDTLIKHIHVMDSATEYRINKSETAKITYRAFAEMWSLVEEIKWEKFSSQKNAYRLSLPTYPFQKKSYWPTRQSAGKKDFVLETINNSENCFYKSSWQRTELLETIARQPLLDQKGKQSWLIFINKDWATKDIKQYLYDHLQNVVFIYAGNQFIKKSPTEYEIDPAAEQHYHDLMKSLVKKTYQEYVVLNFWPYCGSQLQDMEDVLNKGFYLLFYLARCFSSVFPYASLRIVNVAKQLFSVFAGETACPAQSALLGAARVVPFEFPNIKIRSVDIAENDKFDLQKLISLMQFEVNCSMDSINENMIAYRCGYRWRQEFIQAHLVDDSTRSLLNSKGVYIVIGGLGGIGLEIAQKLILEHRLTVVLLSRRTLPPKETWGDWLRQHVAEDENYRLIQRLNLLQAQNNNFYVLNADVSSLDSMRKAVETIQSDIGKIQGVVHAAGLAGSGLILNKSREKIETVLSSKLQGTYVLSALFKNTPLDFILFFSSITSISGGIGQIDYCAANACLDSLPDANLFHANTRVITLNWNKWDNVGMTSVESAVKNAGLPLAYQEIIDKNSVQLTEGCLLFFKVLNSLENHLIVSKMGLQEYQNKLFEQALAITHCFLKKDPEVVLTDAASVPEDNFIIIVKKLLGLNSIALKDNFFDLGGHSLIALQLIDAVEKQFSVTITIADIYQAKHLSDLVALVSDKKVSHLAASYIIPMKKTGKKPPLFLIHPVGGTVFCYLGLIKMLQYDGPIFAIQDPGLTSLDYQFSSLEDMAAFYLADIQTLCPKGPYVLAGFSLGGILAFEITHQLLSKGFTVNFLGLIDSWAVLHDYKRTNFEKSMRDQLQHFKQQLKKIGLADFKSLLPCQLSRMRLLEAYRPQIVPIKIHLYKAAELLPQYCLIEDANNHWEKFTTLKIEKHIVPGNHENLLYLPHVRFLVHLLNEHLLQNSH